MAFYNGPRARQSGLQVEIRDNLAFQQLLQTLAAIVPDFAAKVGAVEMTTEWLDLIEDLRRASHATARRVQRVHSYDSANRTFRYHFVTGSLVPLEMWERLWSLADIFKWGWRTLYWSFNRRVEIGTFTGTDRLEALRALVLEGLHGCRTYGVEGVPM